jgi:Tol biopolymer transport system component
LARAPLAGGAPRDVLESVEGADWAPDGTSLAVVRSAAGKSRLEFPIGRVLFETHGWISHPRVSPRGDAVAFLEHPNPDQSGSVAVVDTSGKARILLADLVSAYGLAWHPSGREVWFTGSRKAIDNSVRAVSLDGRERTVFEAPARLILHDIFPDGRALFATESLRGEIAGRGPGAPTERPLHWLDFSILNDLSPDGSRLLLTEGGEGAGVDFQIYLRKLDDSPAVHLGKGFGGSLSPDGKWVLASQPSGPQRLLLLPTGVGEELTIERHGIESYQTARWFPDGERIVFAGTEPGRDLRLYVQALAGGPPRAITAEGVRLAWPLEDAVSSDGRWVTAVGPDGAIGQYPVQGGDPQRLPGLDREDSLVRWIEYGRSAYVWRSNERPSPIYRLDLSNGRRTLVTSVLPADPTGVGGLLSLVMTSDASAYAYHYARHLGELYLVQGLR